MNENEYVHHMLSDSIKCVLTFNVEQSDILKGGIFELQKILDVNEDCKSNPHSDHLNKRVVELNEELEKLNSMANMVTNMFHDMSRDAREKRNNIWFKWNHMGEV